MIEIHVYNCRLEVKGHAGAGPCGEDLVCAGVSTLVYTLAESLQGMDGFFCHLEPGDAVLSCRPSGRAMAAFRFAKTGLRLLAESFPENISIIFEGMG